MFFGQCGSKIDEDSAFCSKCGSKQAISEKNTHAVPFNPPEKGFQSFLKSKKPKDMAIKFTACIVLGLLIFFGYERDHSQETVINVDVRGIYPDNSEAKTLLSDIDMEEAEAMARAEAEAQAEREAEEKAKAQAEREVEKTSTSASITEPASIDSSITNDDPEEEHDYENCEDRAGWICLECDEYYASFDPDSPYYGANVKADSYYDWELANSLYGDMSYVQVYIAYRIQDTGRSIGSWQVVKPQYTDYYAFYWYDPYDWSNLLKNTEVADGIIYSPSNSIQGTGWVWLVIRDRGQTKQLVSSDGFERDYPYYTEVTDPETLEGFWDYWFDDGS
jgi:hypothetical protein